jgi:hypothetical protein
LFRTADGGGLGEDRDAVTDDEARDVDHDVERRAVVWNVVAESDVDEFRELEPTGVAWTGRCCLERRGALARGLHGGEG